jgi:hypothetical protein
MHSDLPEPATSPGRPTARHPAARHRIRRRHLAAGIAAGIAILAGGGTALLTLSPDPVARTVADDCGLIACGDPIRATGHRDLLS